MKNKYRSKFEANVAQQLRNKKVPVVYEKETISYTQPEKIRKYTPDFKLPSGVYVEVKGRFTVHDRQKHLMIRESNPSLDIRFLFMNSKVKLSKGSKTTYAMWCEKNGFKYADKVIPKKWI